MGIIRVLDRAVADQIAAGEVVERPASVVKELVENAADAGARLIRVEIEAAGSNRITVIDDGVGMIAQDAVLAFSRHATSKLHVSDDLLSLTTFGFRGEALAAIASVADVRLLTRPAAQAVGTEVHVRGGQLLSVTDAGAPAGTRVDVHRLFEHVPARRKFLRSQRTEMAMIDDVLLAAASVNAHVAWQLMVDGKAAWSLAAVAEADDDVGGAARIERALHVLGAHVRPHLHPFSASSDLLTLRGHVVSPVETRRDAGGVHLSVNGRPVQDRQLGQAVRTAYRTMLEAGRHPQCVLDIIIDHDQVDINVHPRKAEVRFADSRRVISHIIALLSDFLSGMPWLKAEGEQARPYVRRFVLASSDDASTPPPPNAATDEHRARIRLALARFTPSAASPFATIAATAAAPSSSFQSLRVLGEMGKRYLVCEGPSGMVVIDHHAARHRLVFERLLRSVVPASQTLVVPMTIAVTAAECAVLGSSASVLLWPRLGVDVDVFGDHTVMVRSLPVDVDVDADRVAALLRLGIAAVQDGPIDDSSFAAICVRVARLRPYGNAVMLPEEMGALLRALDGVPWSDATMTTLPAVIRQWSMADMAGWFP